MWPPCTLTEGQVQLDWNYYCCLEWNVGQIGLGFSESNWTVLSGLIYLQQNNVSHLKDIQF